MNNQKKYGWYSQKGADSFGYVEYTNLDGEIVRVSTVTRDPEKCPLKFDDAVFVGELKNFVREKWKNI